MELRVLLLVPVYGMMVLLLGAQLLDIAESASAKTVAFASDMEAAVDCAMRAIPLQECSPGIFSHDFKPEINGTLNATEEFLRALHARTGGLDVSVNETENATIVVIIKE
ncbi:hypothetical protein D6764_03915 [Candidatus Woesearchaeota archaeon]|nr:MAG: hypothetical protein D6764_03915 [Candidatus Woesearchaeota archaeon]